MTDDVPEYAEIKDDKNKRVITIRAIAPKTDTEGLTGYSKEELEELLVSLAEREFEKEKEQLRKEFRERGLPTEDVDLAISPSELNALRERLESAPRTKRNTQFYKASPSGKVSMLNYGSNEEDIDMYREFETPQEMLDYLYSMAEHGNSQQKRKANEILDQLFKKLGNVGKIKYSGSEQ